MTTDPFATAAGIEFKRRFQNMDAYRSDARQFDLFRAFRSGMQYAASQEPTDAEVEAAHAAYWPAYSEAVRNASSNRPGQGISAEDARKAGLAGHRAALSAARAVGRDAR